MLQPVFCYAWVLQIPAADHGFYGLLALGRGRPSSNSTGKQFKKVRTHSLYGTHQENKTLLFIKKLFREPLVHFVLLGALIFATYSLVTNDDNRILVSEQSLSIWMQYRNKAFTAADSKAQLSRLSNEELQRMIEDYVQEEVLYREALKLGLDSNDAVIRQRIIQKMEFMLLGLTGADQAVSRSAALSYFNDNQQRYEIPAHITLTHRYFSGDAGQDRAKAFLTLSESAQEREQGERFIYKRNYVESRYPLIRDHLGENIADAVFSSSTPVKQWLGPFESPYGWHSVRIVEKAEARIPEFDEVAPQVASDLQRERRAELKAEAVQKLVAKYRLDKQFQSAP